LGEDIIERFHLMSALKAKHAHILGQSIGEGLTLSYHGQKGTLASIYSEG
jgi:hypothetical protein